MTFDEIRKIGDVPCLSPVYTNHPASVAYRVTLSTHEWTWTQKEQEDMAEAVVQLDSIRIKLTAERDQLRHELKLGKKGVGE